MSPTVLFFWLALIGILLALATYLGTWRKPGVKNPVIVAFRLAIFGVVGVISLGLAAHLGYAPFLEGCFRDVAVELEAWASKCLSVF